MHVSRVIMCPQDWTTCTEKHQILAVPYFSDKPKSGGQSNGSHPWLKGKLGVHFSRSLPQWCPFGNNKYIIHYNTVQVWGLLFTIMIVIYQTWLMTCVMSMSSFHVKPTILSAKDAFHGFPRFFINQPLWQLWVLPTSRQDLLRGIPGEVRS